MVPVGRKTEVVKEASAEANGEIEDNDSNESSSNGLGQSISAEERPLDLIWQRWFTDTLRFAATV